MRFREKGRGRRPLRSTSIALRLTFTALATVAAEVSGATVAWAQPEDLLAGQARSTTRGTTTPVSSAAAEGSTPAAFAPPGDRASVDGEKRIRLAPHIAGGIGAIGGHTTPFPHLIGITEFGVELAYEVVPWGGWLSGSYESSGAVGQWTAPSLAGGVAYRLFGDGVKKTSLVVRGGLAYERWHAASNACSITLFLPSSCRVFPPRNPDGSTPAGYTVTDDNSNSLGVLAGVRVELPLEKVYLALDASFVPSVNLGDEPPGSAFTARFGLVIGFRDREGLGRKSDTVRDRGLVRARKQ